MNMIVRYDIRQVENEYDRNICFVINLLFSAEGIARDAGFEYDAVNIAEIRRSIVEKYVSMEIRDNGKECRDIQPRNIRS